MALFDVVKERDFDLRDVIGMPIHVLRAGIRKTNTVYGETDAVDLWIDVNGEEKYVSGFSAGIVRQIRQSASGDFPCWARIEEKQLGRGKSTTELIPSQEGEMGQLSLQGESDNELPF